MTALALWLIAFNRCSDAFVPLNCLMKPVQPSAEVDPRQTGWPCHGMRKAGREKKNQFAHWQSCQR